MKISQILKESDYSQKYKRMSALLDAANFKFQNLDPGETGEQMLRYFWRRWKEGNCPLDFYDVNSNPPSREDLVGQMNAAYRDYAKPNPIGDQRDSAFLPSYNKKSDYYDPSAQNINRRNGR